jgi:hypothetical protein
MKVVEFATLRASRAAETGVADARVAGEVGSLYGM